MSKGYVYVLSNPSMPGMVKIGRTERSVQQRANELWQTGVPTPFKVECEVRSPDCAEMERWAHEKFHQFRVSEGREFFRVECAEVLEFLERQLLDQLRDFVSEFDECHVLVEEPFCLDEAAISKLADDLSQSTYDIATALSFVSADELRPALNRWINLKAELRERRKQEGQSGLVAANG